MFYSIFRKVCLSKCGVLYKANYFVDKIYLGRNENTARSSTVFFFILKKDVSVWLCLFHERLSYNFQYD